MYNNLIMTNLSPPYGNTRAHFDGRSRSTQTSNARAQAFVGRLRVSRHIEKPVLCRAPNEEKYPCWTHNERPALTHCILMRLHIVSSCAYTLYPHARLHIVPSCTQHDFRGGGRGVLLWVRHGATLQPADHLPTVGGSNPGLVRSSGDGVETRW